jgi:hypothetical protein
MLLMPGNEDEAVQLVDCLSRSSGHTPGTVADGAVLNEAAGLLEDALRGEP